MFFVRGDYTINRLAFETYRAAIFILPGRRPKVFLLKIKH